MERSGWMKTGRLQGIEPAPVWRWFEELCAIPRASGDEERVSGFVDGFALERGLEHFRDATGNVIVKKPGSGPNAGSPAVMIQAHLDMVAEKREGSLHDFSTDPVLPEVDGDWVIARETTLGADNGLGAALMLALLDDRTIGHPPLECLFTVDEERGLTGAAAVDPAWISARRMINLDSEQEGAFCIGCAGGVDVTLTLGLERMQPPPDMEILLISVDGLKGGHSGMAIGRWRANAIRLLARVLDRILDRGGLLCNFDGGSKRNAIPRTAGALVTIPSGSRAAVAADVSALLDEARSEYAGIDQDISIRLLPGAGLSSGDPVTPASARRCTDLLLALPHGVEKMSGISSSLVETSVNLALAGTRDGVCNVVLTVRSLLDRAKDALAGRVMALGRLAGAEVERNGGYPGWKPDPGSALLASAVATYMELHGTDPVVETVHAGLECGIIGARIPGMEMISMGPDIRDVHIPGERASISSTERFWRYLKVLLERI
jgi:dipeptidase D